MGLIKNTLSSTMFSVTLLIPVIGLILVAVVILFGFLLGSGEQNTEEEENYDGSDDEPEVLPKPESGASRNVAEVPDGGTPHRDIRSYDPKDVARHDNGYYNNENHERVRFQRPATPVQNNHYRPVTPVHQIRPITPHGIAEERTRIASPTGVPSYRQSGESSDVGAGYKTYQDLTDEERSGVTDLSRCYIDIRRSELDPFLNRINAMGTGVTAQYVVGRFDKTNDSQLSPSHRFIRKSFKIKNKKTNKCRFARLRVIDSGDGYYRLVFNDYTPYVAEHAPRFDVYNNQEKADERSHWENVNVVLHFNSERINISHLLILMPGGKTKH